MAGSERGVRAHEPSNVLLEAGKKHKKMDFPLDPQWSKALRTT